jgi:hypothetical protein
MNMARRLGRLEGATIEKRRMVVVMAARELATADILAARGIVEGPRDFVVRVNKPLGATVRVTVDGVEL